MILNLSKCFTVNELNLSFASNQLFSSEIIKIMIRKLSAWLILILFIIQIEIHSIITKDGFIK